MIEFLNTPTLHYSICWGRVMSSLKLTFFGSPQVELDGERIALKTRKALALLAYLVVSRQSHSREALATLFWPEFSSKRAFANLRGALRSLTRQLTDRWFEISRLNVEFKDTPDLWADVFEFQHHCDRVSAHGHGGEIVCDQCFSSVRAAIDLYQGDFLHGSC